MPARNSRKVYYENGFYHVYNRGVEKRPIFEDQQDISVFLSYLKEYLAYRDDNLLTSKLSTGGLPWREREEYRSKLQLNNFFDEISLLCYGLMPNHFHFLLRQKQERSMDILMNSLGTRYTMYFNRKYKRVGSLYQGVYKAVEVDSEEYLLYLSKYIHYQTLVVDYPSSFEDYIGWRKTDWVNTNVILSYFSKKNDRNSYEAFVKGVDFEGLSLVKDLVLDD
ncbi:hypothetical protein A2368_04260 [Candidatus Collierbacteria bacterium RIFOXYB1_FULL_49_13]|uniref:Transposase IS200-like domain-containing protein n=1 Tax=Candidatus Collierbacteria bacterium RIFOXYB1_FULL_49_13 TaxID=1817728 RepID=A0A1F5FJK6_9BACT|nr:MAG: hypothetical protein A2368_04260 [Candidatus Collierbacteria bacterium RIFOXYB1_FULL_49_13]